MSGCASKDGCPADPGGTPWTPDVSGAASTYHDSNVVITRDVYTATHELAGLGQGIACTVTNTATCKDTRSRIIDIPFDMTTDLGVNGSVSLTAETVSMDTDLVGSAYPVLVSVDDGNGHELIILPITAGTGACATQGFFTCPSGVCAANPACAPVAPSAYKDWDHWRQFNIPAYGAASNNVFPTCNWTSGTPTCHFGDASGGNFFSGGGKLLTGTYTAHYVLLTTNYSFIQGYNAGIRLTVTRKKDTGAPALPPAAVNNGAVDVNVILVGSKNIAAGRTAKGHANLNALLRHVQDLYSSASDGLGVRLGTISSYEWSCAQGGDDYSTLDFRDVGDLLKAGSKLVASASEGKAINVFLVSEITYTTAGTSILGVSGAIGGPMINGTGSSGVVFKSFDKIDTFNPDCGSGSGVCDPANQEAKFVDWGATVGHEMGHYLGLNHPQEKDGSQVDPVPDTPSCSTQTISGKPVVTFASCQSAGTCAANCAARDGVSVFCPTESACQFNHIMWYTSKGYNEALDTGDGNMFSPQSATVVNYSPFVW
ncbi:MAG TPA: hypothetical protein VL588_06385 [Bdellovibrionota bacterium]|nr:hypothetical protein [Bdellovibrionota bacterium]